MSYCESIFKTKRRQTREVMVGNVGVGGHHPVRIQSMTTSNTRDVEATVDQIIRLADAGCEIARVTVQGMKEADACEGIKNSLLQKGYTIPVVADIHFFPPAAMRVVDFVDKVRVNPGNFVDKRASFKLIEYTDDSYAQELIKIEEKFTPLVEKCKHLKRSMRIGTNHGSLSDRIMNRYGDTPRGMVESALEFARICRQNDYHDFMFSMKSSNPQVMILAYRLLSLEMDALGWNYPLHLGVTEAGQGEDGRIKSAMGIGALLLDGIGDTIRVSLTEDPWHEIDPCRRLVQFAKDYSDMPGITAFEETFRNIEDIQRRTVSLPRNVSMHRDGTVIVSTTEQELLADNAFEKFGCDLKQGEPKLKISSADNVALTSMPTVQESVKKLQTLLDIGVGVFTSQAHEKGVHLLSLAEAVNYTRQVAKKQMFALQLANQQATTPIAIRVEDEPESTWSIIGDLQPSVIILSPTSENRLHKARRFFEWMQQNKISTPVILNFAYTCSQDDLIIQAAAECGSLFTDGLGDGIWLQGPYETSFLRTLSFNILQAARMRTSKTDFISCPSCGRTLFNLQEVTKNIQARTSHLPGVKIAIMGCIVNGPGEMADADFGYVGSRPGMIDLYVGKDCVEKNIDFSAAVERLVDLIKRHGRWTEPAEV